MRNISNQAGMPRRTLRREALRPRSPVHQPTRLEMRWTVDQSVDPNLCTLGQAVAVDIRVSTTSGDLVGEFRAPCAAFATTISALPPGDYVAEAVFIDAAGEPRTTVIAIHPFAVLERSELVIDVDFPADAFLDSVDRETIRFLSESDPARGASPASSDRTYRGEGDEPHRTSEFDWPETR